MAVEAVVADVAGRRNANGPDWIIVRLCGIRRCQPPPFSNGMLVKDFDVGSVKIKGGQAYHTFQVFIGLQAVQGRQIRLERAYILSSDSLNNFGKAVLLQLLQNFAVPEIVASSKRGPEENIPGYDWCLTVDAGELNVICGSNFK